MFDMELRLPIDAKRAVVAADLEPPPPPHRMPFPLKVPPALFHQASLTTCQYSFKLARGERHCDSEVFCPSTQHNDPARSLAQTTQPGVYCTKHWATASPMTTTFHSLLAAD